MIYVGSPYEHKKKKVMQERYDAVCRFCYLATKNKFHVFSPIVHWHPIAVKYGLPRDAKFWGEWNLQMLHSSSTVWILTLEGYKESIGLKGEIVIAEEASIYWRYINPDFFG